MHRKLLYVPAILALALTAWPAAAEQNEAEKLFRGMEEKVRAAKTLQLRIDLSITDLLGKKGSVQGALILGEGDKYRLELEGKEFGAAVTVTEVSDGVNMSMKDANNPKSDATQKAQKDAGAYFRGALPRWGLFLSTLNRRRPGGLAPDAIQLSDFQLAGKDKIGERDTQAIQYMLKEKGAKEALSMKLWLDAETHLPVKLAVTGGKSDWKDLTETYSEFTLDGDVDAKSFELPK